ncbi:MAG: dihydrofolate reductase family protein [Streptosporangiaceae bacterium]
MRQIYPVHGPDWTVTPKASAGPLPDGVAGVADMFRAGVEPVPGRAWLRANMVASTDGAATIAGRSGGLSGPADRMVFTVLRSLADVILVGAGTARTERYRPVSAAGIWTGLRPAGAALPVIAVVTASFDLEACAALLTAEHTIIITSAQAAAQGGPLASRAEVIVAGQRRVDVRQAVTALAARGYAHILVEGGPSLLGQLVSAQLLDEFCLTISPVLTDAAAGRVVAVPPAARSVPTSLTLAHVLTDADFLLCRYLRQPSPESA